MSIEPVMPSNHLILCHPLLLLPSIFPSIRVFSNESVLCNIMDCSLPGSSIHVIVQSRILEWVPMPPSKGSSRPRDWIHVSYIAGRFFTTDYLETHQYNTPPIMNCVLFFMQRGNKLEGLPYLHRFRVILHDLAARLSHFGRWQIIVKKHRNEQIIG